MCVDFILNPLTIYLFYEILNKNVRKDISLDLTPSYTWYVLYYLHIMMTPDIKFFVSYSKL